MADYGDPTQAAEQGLGGAVQAGVGLATGNPIAIIGGIASLVGAGMSFFGASGEAKVQQQEAQVSEEVAATQMQIDKQRQILAQAIYNRQVNENFRKTNIAYHTARAAGAAAGTSLIGGQQSSGVAGGMAQTEAEGATNQVSLGLNYQIGQNIFGLTQQEDQLKIQMAQLGGQAAGYAGQAALGGAIASAGPALTRLSGGFGLPNPGLQV